MPAHGAEVSRPHAPRATRNGSDRTAIYLAEVSGSPLYVVHVSSAGAADAISDGGNAVSRSTANLPAVSGLRYERLRPAGLRRRELRDVAALRDKWNQNVLIASSRTASCRASAPTTVRFCASRKSSAKTTSRKSQRRADDRRPRRDRLRADRQRRRRRTQPVRPLTSTNPAKLFGSSRARARSPSAATATSWFGIRTRPARSPRRRTT